MVQGADDRPAGGTGGTVLSGLWVEIVEIKPLEPKAAKAAVARRQEWSEAGDAHHAVASSASAVQDERLERWPDVLKQSRQSIWVLADKRPERANREVPQATARGGEDAADVLRVRVALQVEAAEEAAPWRLLHSVRLLRLRLQFLVRSGSTERLRDLRCVCEGDRIFRCIGPLDLKMLERAALSVSCEGPYDSGQGGVGPVAVTRRRSAASKADRKSTQPRVAKKGIESRGLSSCRVQLCRIGGYCRRHQQHSVPAGQRIQ